MKSYCLTIVFSSYFLFLSACSSSPNTTDSANSPATNISNIIGSLSDVQQMGWVFLTDSVESQRLSTFATFYVAPISSQDSVIQRYVSRQADNCTVELLGIDDALLEDSLLNDYNSISAGEILTLSSPAGSFAELTRAELQNGIGYISLSEIPYPIPQTLTIDVPGDDFGASSITIEKPSVPINVSLSYGDIVSAETNLTWNASGENDTLLYAYFEDESNPDLYVECLLIDDGEFRIPASIFTDAETLVSGGDTTLTFDGLSRLRAASNRIGSDLLVVVRSSS